MTGITKQHVESVFVHLTSGDSAKFFSYVSDNISWTVTGSSHPLAQLWNSKQAFIDGSWKRVGGIMQKPMQLEIIGVMIEQSDENAKGLAGRALVELAGKGGVLKSGKLIHL
jgi:hypothetical protein